MVILTNFKCASTVWAVCIASTCSGEYILQSVVMSTKHWVKGALWFARCFSRSSSVTVFSPWRVCLFRFCSGICVDFLDLPVSFSVDLLVWVWVDWLLVGFWLSGCTWKVDFAIDISVDFSEHIFVDCLHSSFQLVGRTWLFKQGYQILIWRLLLSQRPWPKSGVDSSLLKVHL